MKTRTVIDADGTWIESVETDTGAVLSRQLILPSDSFLTKQAVIGSESWPSDHEESKAAIAWSKARKEREDADASDSTVAQMISDVQAAKANVKETGWTTLSKADAKAICRAELYLLKGDKTS